MLVVPRVVKEKREPRREEHDASLREEKKKDVCFYVGVFLFWTGVQAKFLLTRTTFTVLLHIEVCFLLFI